jgi:hypothetical protein
VNIPASLTASDGPSVTPNHPWRGLLLQEWLTHRRSIYAATAIWLITVVVIEPWSHPLAMALFGAGYALSVVAGIVTADTRGGTEEFSFSLPATRGQRYLARMVFAVVPLLAMQFVGACASAAGLAQSIWGVEPAHPPSLRLHVLSVALPLAIVAATFVTGACSSWRAFFGSPQLAGLLVAIPVWKSGTADGSPWEPLGRALVVALPVLAIGYHSYRRQEVSVPVAPRRSSGILTVIVLFVLGSIVLTAVLSRMSAAANGG